MTDNYEVLRTLIEANDKRYTELNEAREKALSAALASAEKAVSAALAAAEKAVTKAEIAADKRFDAVNEFRETLSDQTNTFLTRAEYQAQHAALQDKVDKNTSDIEKGLARSGGLTAGWGYLIGGVGLVGAVIAIVAALSK